MKSFLEETFHDVYPDAGQGRALFHRNAILPQRT